MNIINIDGRAHTEENDFSLLEVVINDVLSKKPGKVFSIKEIYQELIEKKLYSFSRYAKTPCNSISTRLSSAFNQGLPGLCKSGKGNYFVI